MLDDLGRFYCKPLSCWLRPESCAGRHTQARESSDDKKRLVVLRLDKCHDCNVGAAHARGLPTPETFEKIAPAFDVFAKAPPKNFGIGICPWCKEPFKRLAGNHDFCVRKHAKSFYRAVAREGRLRRRRRRERIKAMQAAKTMKVRPCMKCKSDFTPVRTPFEKVCPTCRGVTAEQIREMAGPVVPTPETPPEKAVPQAVTPKESPIASKALATPAQILETCGYKVKVLQTPSGELLQVQ